MEQTTNEYYPNTEFLEDEEGRLYKYVYRGKGYFNKRTLHEAMVWEFLSEDAQKLLEDAKAKAFKKLREVYPDDTFAQTGQKLNVGFFNQTTSSVHYDLEKLALEISEGDEIHIIAFNMPYGKVSTLASFPLKSGVLNAEGEKLLSGSISSNPLQDDKVESSIDEQPTKAYSASISTDPLA